MGGIIAVAHRRVAPAPVESKYSVPQDNVEYHHDDGDDRDSSKDKTIRTAQQQQNDDHLDFVLCVHSPSSLGITTVPITTSDNLMKTRHVVELLAKKHPALLPDGRFLFSMPDNTLCQRGWEQDVKTLDAGWQYGGGMRLVIKDPSKSMGSKQSDEKEEEAETEAKTAAEYQEEEEEASTPSSPPSIMARSLLTPTDGDSNTHTLTGTSEILHTLREEESLLQHQEAIQRLNARELKLKGRAASGAAGVGAASEEKISNTP